MSKTEKTKIQKAPSKTEKSKNSFSFIKIFDAVSKYSIYLLVFLLPIIFLPWTSEVLDFNKQGVLIILGFVSLFFWMARAMFEKKIKLNLSKINVFVILLFLVYLISTIFSVNWRGSFWGWPQVSYQSMATMIGLFIVYFLISNTFAKKEIYKSIIILVSSVFLAQVFGLMQMFRLFIFPFEFAKNVTFNTIGATGGFGLVVAIMVPLIFFLLFTAQRKISKIFYYVVVALSLLTLIIINYSALWWISMISSVLAIVFCAIKKDIFDVRFTAIPMFILAISVFFIVSGLQIKGLNRGINEVSLSQKTSLNIAVNVLRDKPILGSGPGTFVYDFGKYRDADFNKSSLWNVSFSKATSEFLNNLSTIGILGALVFVALIVAVIVSFLDFIRKERHNKKTESSAYILMLGVFALFFAETLGFFLLNFNLTLSFVYFFVIASLAGLISTERKEYVLKASSLQTLATTLVFTIVFIFGIGMIILSGQRYAADINYYKGIVDLNQKKIDDGIKKIEIAASINSGVDLYFRQLAQIYISKIDDLVNNKDLSVEEKTKKINLYVANSINAAKTATDLDLNNADNWTVRGMVYQNLIGFANDTDNWATKSYDEAIKLNPLSPYLPVQKGTVLLKQAEKLPKEKDQERKSLISLAKDQFQKAITLKEDYGPAYVQLATALSIEGNSEDALKVLEDTKKFAPNDATLAFQIGFIYYQKNDFQNAKSELEKALAISPNYSNALYFLGLSYFNIGQVDLSIEKFAKLLELNPENSQVIKILDNLRSGKNPLEETGQSAPISNVSPENNNNSVDQPAAPVEGKSSSQTQPIKK